MAYPQPTPPTVQLAHTRGWHSLQSPHRKGAVHGEIILDTQHQLSLGQGLWDSLHQVLPPALSRVAAPSLCSLELWKGGGYGSGSQREVSVRGGGKGPSCPCTQHPALCHILSRAGAHSILAPLPGQSDWQPHSTDEGIWGRRGVLRLQCDVTGTGSTASPSARV